MADDDREAIGPATPATDLLEDNGLDDDAATLRAAPAKAALLERAVEKIEDFLSNGPIRAWSVADPLVEVIAEHRGETPEATLGRLRSPVSAGYRLGLRSAPSGPPLDVGVLRHSVDAMLREFEARPDRGPG